MVSLLRCWTRCWTSLALSPDAHQQGYGRSSATRQGRDASIKDRGLPARRMECRALKTQSLQLAKHNTYVCLTFSIGEEIVRRIPTLYASDPYCREALVINFKLCNRLWVTCIATVTQRSPQLVRNALLVDCTQMRKHMEDKRKVFVSTSIQSVCQMTQRQSSYVPLCRGVRHKEIVRNRQVRQLLVCGQVRELQNNTRRSTNQTC